MDSNVLSGRVDKPIYDLEKRTWRVAVVGAGSIGMRHLRVLQRMPGVLPVAIPTRPARFKELKEDGYVAARDLLEAARMGATLCIVATDTGRHVEDAFAAVENRMDVLVEKPLSTDASEAKKLCLRTAGSGRQIFVGCVLRFSESLNRFRDLLNRIGHLHSVRIECQSYLPDWRPGRPYQELYSARAAEGGVLRDLIHEIDYAGWIFGWPKTLQARIRNLGRLGIESDEVADLMWETRDGCMVSVCLDYLTRPSRRRIRVLGEHGTLEWDGIENITTLALADATVQVMRSSQTRDEMFLEQARAFIDACQGLRNPRLATGEDGVKALAVCDAGRRASESRREEHIDYR